MRNLSLCSVFLAMAAAICGPAGTVVAAHAQASQVTAAVAPRMLYIDVLEGEGELNDIRARIAREPVVQVKDENHKPVAGALVLFAIQTGGGAQPVSVFSGLPTLTVRTGADGTARANGYRAGRTGNVQILVTATVGAVVAQIIIHQTNYVPGGHFRQTLSTHKALIGAMSELAAFAAATSVIVVESQTSPAVITAGPGTVTAGRSAAPGKR